MTSEDVRGAYGVGTRLEPSDDLSARSDVMRLRDAWLQEKFSPEILKYERKLVGDIMEQLDNQQENIIEMDPKTNSETLNRSLYQLELERIRYILEDYHRIRLEKIQNQCNHILTTNARDNLNESEIVFSKDYKELVEGHLDDSFLQYLPNKLKSIADVKMEKLSQKPELGSYVFGYVEENIGQLALDELGQQNVNLDEGDLIVARYSLLSRFVRLGSVKLR